MTNGIPSEDTCRRVLARLDPTAFETALLGWMQAMQEITGHRLVAIDGKTLRGSYNKRDGKAAIHMVSAWATENKLSLGQVVVDEKSNEITAIPALLELLELSGAVVTIDAMGCQKEIAATIRERGGDYVLAVKLNQPTLYEQVCKAVDEGLEQDAAQIDEHQYSGGLQSDPSLEGCRMSLRCACHDAPRNGTVISDQFNIPSGPVLGGHLTCGRDSLEFRLQPVRTPAEAGTPAKDPGRATCPSEPLRRSSLCRATL